MAKMIIEGKEVEVDTGEEAVDQQDPGGAQFSIPESEDPEQNEPVAGTPATPGEAQPLFRGLTKTFNTPEELADYARELERKQIEAEAEMRGYKAATPGQPAPATSTPPVAKQYGEKFFINPDEALAELSSDIEAKIERKIATQNKDKADWDDFYRTNPDLVGLEELVQFQLGQNQASLVGKPIEYIKDQLALKTRAYVAKVNKVSGHSEAMPMGSTIVAGATRGSVPRAALVEAAPKTFVEQIKGLRKKPIAG